LDLEHEVLQVGVHTRLRIDGVLLVGQQMVELDDAYRYGLQFLRAEERLSKVAVFQHLVGDDGGDVASFCDIPPVITVKRSVKVVSETLENLVDLLFLKESILQIDGHFRLSRWRLHRLLVQIQLGTDSSVLISGRGNTRSPSHDPITVTYAHLLVDEVGVIIVFFFSIESEATRRLQRLLLTLLISTFYEHLRGLLRLHAQLDLFALVAPFAHLWWFVQLVAAEIVRVRAIGGLTGGGSVALLLFGGRQIGLRLVTLKHGFFVNGSLLIVCDSLASLVERIPLLLGQLLGLVLDALAGRVYSWEFHVLHLLLH